MTPYYTDHWLTVYQGDALAVLRELPDTSVHCVVTSPPYWGLRDYGTPGQLGLEPTPAAYVAAMVEVFREVRRVLRADGTLWLNIGDSYAGSRAGDLSTTNRGNVASRRRDDRLIPRSDLLIAGLKPKDLVGIPWRLAFALQADGWYLRSDIIWAKPNPMPESVTDRPTKSHEYLFLLSKSARYFYDADAVRESLSPDTHPSGNGFDRGGVRISHGEGSPNEWTPTRDLGQKLAVAPKDVRASASARMGRGAGFRDVDGTQPSRRNLRSVWSIATEPYPGAHFATFPRKLVEPCIKAGCPSDGTALDPFAGTGTVGLVAQALSRRAVLIDLSMDYLDQLLHRNRQTPLGLVG